MITKYGKVIIEEDTITFREFEADGSGAPFSIIEWAKKRLEGKTTEEIESEGNRKHQKSA